MLRRQWRLPGRNAYARISGKWPCLAYAPEAMASRKKAMEEQTTPPTENGSGGDGGGDEDEDDEADEERNVLREAEGIQGPCNRVAKKT